MSTIDDLQKYTKKNYSTLIELCSYDIYDIYNKYVSSDPVYTQ